MTKRFTFADGFKIVAIRDNGEIMNSRQVCDKLNELYEENTHIKNTIKEQYNNERTQLGKSVLKQLYEAIQ